MDYSVRGGEREWEWEVDWGWEENCGDSREANVELLISNFRLRKFNMEIKLAEFGTRSRGLCLGQH